MKTFKVLVLVEVNNAPVFKAMKQINTEFNLSDEEEVIFYNRQEAEDFCGDKLGRYMIVIEDTKTKIKH